MKRIIEISLLIFLCVVFSGCTSDCGMGEDHKITVSVVENRDIQTNMGFSNHHIVTLDVTNLGDSLARSVTVKTTYCNEFKLGQRTCETPTINVGDIPPKATIRKYFEYDRVLLQNQLDGKYQLEYNVTSCLPYTTVDNKVFVSQR